MSGGYIEAQVSGEHQVVIFTFYGNVSAAQASAWNQAVLQFKQNALKDQFVGVTIKGEPTPAELLGGTLKAERRPAGAARRAPRRKKK